MTTQINGSTGVSLVQAGVVVQADLASNVVGNGPAFSCTPTAGVSCAVNVITKIPLQTKLFDPTNSFDNVTNYRFQPSVAGYYQFTGVVGFLTSGSSVLGVAYLYKNGVLARAGTTSVGTAVSAPVSTVTGLLYLNGTTDYVELYGLQYSGGAGVNDITRTAFDGFLARAA